MGIEDYFPNYRKKDFSPVNVSIGDERWAPSLPASFFVCAVDRQGIEVRGPGDEDFEKIRPQAIGLVNHLVNNGYEVSSDQGRVLEMISAVKSKKEKSDKSQ